MHQVWIRASGITCTPCWAAWALAKPHTAIGNLVSGAAETAYGGNPGALAGRSGSGGDGACARPNG